jgi:uncharacterized membrane protein/gas vesicle protein
MNNSDERYDYGQYHYADEGGSGGGFIAGALTGAVLASALTWLLDPENGTARRSKVRAKAATAYQRSRSTASAAYERASGAYQKGREGLGSATERARDVAERGRERLRTMRGRAASTAEGAASEAAQQGGDWLRQAGQMLGGSQGSRLASGAAGLGLAGWGLARRGPLGLVLGAAGLYLVATAARQKSGRSVSSGIEIENEVTINRPVHEVYEFVQRPETWPQFMQHVESISPIGDRRTHWRVEGPAGVTAEWDAETTEQVPNERICWRTLPGSMVDSEGSLELENDGQGGTRLRLWMIYDPPAGAAGHAVARVRSRSAVGVA